MTGFHRLLRRINEPEIADFNAGSSEFMRDLAEVAFEARFESFKLRPVSLEADAEQSDTEGMGC
jgi:hypothetical protein